MIFRSIVGVNIIVKSEDLSTENGSNSLLAVAENLDPIASVFVVRPMSKVNEDYSYIDKVIVKLDNALRNYGQR